MPDKLLPDHRMRTHHRLDCVCHRPGHLRDVLRNTAQHLSLEIFYDFRPSLIPPHICRRHLFAVLQCQDIGKIWERIGRRFIVVGMIGRRLGPAGPRAQRLDAELIHHVLMVFRGGPIHRLGRRRLPEQGGRREHRQEAKNERSLCALHTPNNTNELWSGWQGLGDRSRWSP
jgi:hypothetical protein